MSSDIDHMRRALALAAEGRGRVEPNPMVGCVITKSNRVIAEGYHHAFGLPHAERDALANCTESPAGATAYVTLEPCCHTNKKTPPCVPALIEARLSRIVVASTDPNPNVSRQGIARLRAAGLQVDVGLLEREAKQLNAPFFAHILLKRPYVTLKWAQSADLKVAGPAGAPTKISNDLSHHESHKLRSLSDAILVGIKTILTDNPLLTARNVEILRPLRRIVLDSNLILPTSAQICAPVKDSPVTVYYRKSSDLAPEARREKLGLWGIRAVQVPAAEHGIGLSLPDILQHLHEAGVTHLIVEGGPTTTKSFLIEGLADRAWIFRSPMKVNDPTAPEAARAKWPATATTALGSDVLTEHLNPDSEVYFAPIASPDFPRSPA